MRTKGWLLCRVAAAAYAAKGGGKYNLRAKVVSVSSVGQGFLQEQQEERRTEKTRVGLRSLQLCVLFPQVRPLLEGGHGQ